MMPEIPLNLPPPANSTDFERLCRALFARHWGISGAQLHGRSGQRQHGVDFFGTNANGQTNGGQSKLHALPAELSESEVRDEVEKAKGFQPPLHQFVIATSSKRDASIQKLARQITSEHRAKGLFEVVVCAWDDLLELLQEHGEVRDQFFGGVTASQARKIETRIFELTESIGGFGLKPDGGGHSEIEIAVADLKAGRIAESRQRLRDLQQRHWEALSARMRFRVLANLGHCAQAEEDFAAAGRLFLEAKEQLPQDEKARYVEALGYACLDNPEKAHELVRVLRNDFPQSVNASCLCTDRAGERYL